LVGQIAYSFGHDAKGWRGQDSAHGADERNGNELGFTFVVWKDQSKVQAIHSSEEESVETVLKVLLVGLWGSKSGIGMLDEPDQSL
jgi:hypothetical protein